MKGEMGKLKGENLCKRGTIVPLWEEGRAQRREFEITHRGFSISLPLRVLPLRLKRESFFVCFNLLSRFAPAPLGLQVEQFFAVNVKSVC